MVSCSITARNRFGRSRPSAAPRGLVRLDGEVAVADDQQVRDGRREQSVSSPVLMRQHAVERR